MVEYCIHVLSDGGGGSYLAVKTPNRPLVSENSNANKYHFN